MLSHDSEYGLQEYIALYFLKYYFGINRSALIRVKTRNGVLEFEFYRTESKIRALKEVINITNHEISKHKSSIFDYIIEDLEMQESENVKKL